jgi:hypothetical protein
MSEWLKEMDCKSIGSAYAGSNPAPPTADVAQLVEHLHGKEGVRGSSPLVGFVRSPAALRDLDLSDGDCDGALGDEPGQERERSCRVRGLYPPPQGMSACEAGRWHAAMPEGAVEALPSGERGRTLVRLVLVVEQKERHGGILRETGRRFIGDSP